MKINTQALITIIAIGSSSFGAIVAHAKPLGKWVCSAPGIASDSHYDGGARAFIHLSKYDHGTPSGYPVKHISATKVTGKTEDKTLFVCTRK